MPEVDDEPTAQRLRRALEYRARSLETPDPAQAVARAKRAGPGRTWGSPARLALVGVVAVVLLTIGFGYSSRRQESGVGNSGSNPTDAINNATPTEAIASGTAVTNTSASPGIVTGPDGIPTQIDGQPVRTMLDQSSWPSNSDSFLLVAQPVIYTMSCPPEAAQASPPYTTAEKDFLTVVCDYASLRPIDTKSSTDTRWLAPKSLAFWQLSVWSWADAPLVMRVHTHDPEAALCTDSRRTLCESAVVVETVVWPTIPSQFDGQHVYTGDEINSMAADGTIGGLEGSILLGGVVWKQDTGTIACSPPPQSAQDELIANCVPTVTIGGAFVAPKSEFTSVTGQLVIVRGHVNDPLAAQCLPNTQSACTTAFVVESVVWTEGPYPLGSQPGPSIEPSPTPNITSATTALSR